MFDDLPRLIRPFLASRIEPQQGFWQPAADVYRTGEGWLIKLELAGVKPDEIQLTVQNRRLLIVGRRRDSSIEESGECYSMEISYSHFERCIEFPTPLDDVRILTDYRDGMLIVRIITEGAHHE